MSNPFVGEIRMFGGNFPPLGWAFCDGSLLSIADNETLFNLIGTTYGGDGQNTFALPDLRGRVPIHQGQGAGLSSRVIGQIGGTEATSLTVAQLPPHRHTLNASTTPTTAAASISGITGTSSVTRFYGSAPGGGDMASTALTAVGSGQAHNNIAPVQCVSFIISLFGIFPSQA
ncbi:MAG: phage tail protein [Burkholderiales bacterium]|nr:phage tail protein [Burkholderiales bacterium]